MNDDTNLTNTCPTCGQPMRRSVQHWGGKHPDLVVEECTNQNFKGHWCPLYMVTRKAGAHALLTEAEIAGYAATNARIEAALTEAQHERV